MRYAFLVAWREYAENIKTKGFWIGIFMFPVMILLSFTAGSWIEKTKSVRTFVLVDQSGKLGQPIDAALERLHQREIFTAFGTYVQKNLAQRSKRETIDLEKTPAFDAEKALEKWGNDNPEMLDAFVKEGGLAAALAQVKPMLRPDAPEFSEPRRGIRKVPLPAGIDANLPPAELAEKLKPYLRGDQQVAFDGDNGAHDSATLFAAVIVPADALEHVVRPGPSVDPEAEKHGLQYWSSNLADEDLKDAIERAVNEEVRRLEYVGKGMDADLVRGVERTHLVIAALDPKKEAGEETVSLADKIRQWAPAGFVYLLWVAIFTIAQMLLNNTIEEKSNRIIEVLLSSVTPGELMMGKLGGIAAVGLTMIGAWMLSLVSILEWKAGQEAEIARELLKVLQSSGLLSWFVIYFVLGYLLYAGVFLAIGSLCNTLKEAQNMMGPAMIVMIVPLLTMAFIPKEPNGTLATVLSWIPIYTPYVMMNRAAADPPMFDRVGTLILLVLTTITMLWLSGRIFRIGILRTGQPPKFMELVRWVRGT